MVYEHGTSILSFITLSIVFMLTSVVELLNAIFVQLSYPGHPFPRHQTSNSITSCIDEWRGGEGLLSPL